jgi:choline-sulfatase
MEAHSPYFPPSAAFEELGIDAPGIIEPRMLNTKLLAYVLGKSDLSPELRQRVYEYYDASLRYQDRKVGELLDTLRAQNAFDDTLVVVCSDHGKTLGEYDRDGVPPHYLRRINTNVPLLIKTPGQRQPARISRPAELAGLYDLFLQSSPDVREALCRSDRALVEDFVPHTAKESEPVTRWRILCDEQYRYIRNEEGDEYLFTASDEPVPDGPMEAMREAMDRRVSTLNPIPEETGDEQDLDAGVEAQLGDLGYLK